MQTDENKKQDMNEPKGMKSEGHKLREHEGKHRKHERKEQKQEEMNPSEERKHEQTETNIPIEKDIQKEEMGGSSKQKEGKHKLREQKHERKHEGKEDWKQKRKQKQPHQTKQEKGFETDRFDQPTAFKSDQQEHGLAQEGEHKRDWKQQDKPSELLEDQGLKHDWKQDLSIKDQNKDRKEDLEQYKPKETTQEIGMNQDKEDQGKERYQETQEQDNQVGKTSQDLKQGELKQGEIKDQKPKNQAEQQKRGVRDEPQLHRQERELDRKDTNLDNKDKPSEHERMKQDWREDQNLQQDTNQKEFNDNDLKGDKQEQQFERQGEYDIKNN